jgi:WD40 repeat protein
VLAVSPNNKLIASATNYDDSILLWNTDKASPERKIQREATMDRREGGVGVQALAFSPDSQLLASSNRDSTIYVWEVMSGKSLRIFLEYSRKPTPLLKP